MALRALLSVSDRTGLHVFARGLRDLGWELIATDGTRAALPAEGISARSIEDVAGTPSLLGGLVKTLHPKIHAALLAARDDPSHLDELKQAGIEPIDLVAVNLYPFGESAAAGTHGAELLEHIDIGGAPLLSGAAKNNQAAVGVGRGGRSRAARHPLAPRGAGLAPARRARPPGGVPPPTPSRPPRA